AAQSAIATSRGVVNMRIPQTRRRIRPHVTGRTSEIGRLDSAERARNNAPPQTETIMFRFATMVRALVLLALLACASFAAAQQAPLVGIDPIRAALDQIEAQSRRGGLGVRALSDLSQRLSPLRDDLRDKLADLEPRLADLDARLKGLGAAP